MNKTGFITNAFLLAFLLPAFLFGFSDGPKKYNKVEEVAWLGIASQNLSPQLCTFFGVEENEGILVSEVAADSPAEKQGIKAGDVIIRIDGKLMRTHRDLESMIYKYDPGQSVTIELIREREQKELTVKLGRRERTSESAFGYQSQGYNFVIPEINIDIPEFEFEVPELDEEELEDLRNDLHEELEMRQEELKESLEEMKENLKEMKIKIGHKSYEII